MVEFGSNLHSIKFAFSSTQQHRFQYQDLRQVEDDILNAVCRELVAEHKAIVQSGINRNKIKNPSRIFNMEQSGESFQKVFRGAFRKKLIWGS